MKTAVVILNYNGETLLRTLLPTVLAHSPQAEVIVADNASTDGSLPLLQQTFPQVRLIALSKNYGFAEGYNRALAQVDADYFVLLNSDVEVTAHWLEPLIDYMEYHADVAACQPKIMSYTDRTKFEYAGACGGYIDALGYPFCRGRILATVETDNGQYDSVAALFLGVGSMSVGACRQISRSRRLGRPFFCPHGGNRPMLASAGAWQPHRMHTAKHGVSHRRKNAGQRTSDENLPQLSQQFADDIQKHAGRIEGVGCARGARLGGGGASVVSG